MKIKSVMFKDFCMIDEITVNFDDNVTYLVGCNGAGKTTVGLTGIEFVLQGIAERAATKKQHPVIGQRFRFIKGDASSAKGAVLLTDTRLGFDILVKRKITATSTELSFEAPPGKQLDQDWLNDLYSEFCLSPESFCSLSGQEQAKALGIDVTDEEAEIKKLKEEYTYTNRRLKEAGKPEPVEEVAPIDEKVLIEKLQKANAFNNQQKILAQQRESKKKEIEECQRKLKQLEQELSQIAEPKEIYDTSKLEEAISKVSEQNRNAMRYGEYRKALELIELLTKSLSDNKEKQDKAQQRKIDKIAGTKLPFKNLSIGEEGELLLEGKLIRPPYFSTGELLMIVPPLLVHTNPELKYVFLQNFNLLDEENQVKIVKYLTGKGYQVCCELIGENKSGSNVIRLKSSKVVEQ